MRLKKGVKRALILIVVLLLVGVLAYGGFRIYSKLNSSDVAKKPEVVNEIKEYGYKLEDNATKLYKSLFEQLKDTLSKEEVNDEDYAKLIAQLMVADFYNIDNKISKSDVGGTDFVLKDYRENFATEATNTVYKYVEHNIYGDRKQELPKVKNVTVKNTRSGSYSYKKITDANAWIITVNIEYEKDLGYPTEVTVKMLHNENKLEVFYMK